MSKLPWSRVLREARQRGETIKLVASDKPVLYRPRFKFDPEPWLEPVSQSHFNGQACYADIS